VAKLVAVDGAGLVIVVIGLVSVVCIGLVGDMPVGCVCVWGGGGGGGPNKRSAKHHVDISV
jgi:hypothetical protein